MKTYFQRKYLDAPSILDVHLGPSQKSAMEPFMEIDNS